MQGNYVVQPSPYSGMQQVIQPIYYGFIGASQQTKYNRKAAMGLGITQMIIGVICLILNIVLMAFAKMFFTSYIAYGIWGGILIFVAGLLQILSAKKVETKRGDESRNHDYYYSGFYYNSDFSYSKSSPGTIGFAIGIILAIMAFVEEVIAITTSALCCCAVCYKSSEMAHIPVYDVGNQPVIFQTYHPGLVLQSGQSFFPSQPSAPQAQTSSLLPQVPTNSGLSITHPPSYDVDWNPGSNSQQPQSTCGKY